ncbi:MAG TPA: phosphatidylserine decarboxylase family protein [Gemmatimonadales bacterium]|nr:phosphatidylserine decarboxylase family protein [Gemmatimonadales bacterium]
MRFAPEGRWFIIGAWGVVAALAVAGVWIGAVVAALLALWVMWFFRDPERRWGRGDDLILAPADGKVMSIIDAEEPTFIGGPATRISIFMNVLDCHVNRYPAEGAVEYRYYNPGKFLNAAGDKASLDNEQSSVGIATGRGPILVRQIAGLIARRIVTDHPVGSAVLQAQRLGMIRFGSRVDLFLPSASVTVLVKVGDVTLAGVTPVARWN